MSNILIKVNYLSNESKLIDVSNTKEERLEYMRNYMRNYRKMNPDYVEKQTERFRQWRQKNPNYHRNYMRKLREEHPEKITQIQQKFRDTHPDYSKLQYNKRKNNPDRHQNSEYHRNYMQKWRKENREEYNKKARMWKALHPKAVKAHTIARTVQLGKQCNDCGSIENLERHHSNYSKPRKITTLCEKCHKRRHLKYAKEEAK